jgi:hypothetical protein
MKLAAALLAFLTPGALGVNVYMLSSGDAGTDAAAMQALTSNGHTVTIGVPYTAFNGTVDLTGFQTVYLQCNANWTAGLMPDAGQQQLAAWVNGGGRLVTSEWVIYYSYVGGSFGVLGTILPAAQSFSYSGALTETFTLATADPAINAGLPASFSFSLTSFTGTETYTVPKAGANSYYSISNAAGDSGLMGWAVGSGSVFSFTSTCGASQVSNSTFGRLFSNVMGASVSSCGSADFNHDGDTATDADIEAFFACVAGTCCASCGSADFNGDGDTATDADIEAFFRVLAGGTC